MITFPPFARVEIERCLAIIALVFVAPVVVLALVLVSTVSPGPTLLLDEIPASNGRAHKSYRIRTTGPGRSALPVVGRWLRRLSIDELPGLWSVAKGDVSLRKWLEWFREK